MISHQPSDSAEGSQHRPSTTEPKVGAELNKVGRNVQNQSPERVKIEVPLIRDAMGIAEIRLGTENERGLTLSVERLRALSLVIDRLEVDPPRGLIITGPNEHIFCAGADINEIRQIAKREDAELISHAGQQLFQRISRLKCVKVAAISGPCIGGGCELALACDYRIMSDHPKSSIGLPEARLGIIPGWGGTQMLPRLVGLRESFKIILGGLTLSPTEALKIGLVDEVSRSADLNLRARSVLLGEASLSHKKLAFVERCLSAHGSVGRMLRAILRVEEKTLKQAIKKAGGDFYPAIPAAVEAICIGLDCGVNLGMFTESRNVGKLATSQTSKSLVHLYLLDLNAKSLGKVGLPSIATAYPLIVGAGQMGSGIATVVAKGGLNLVLKDIDQQALDCGIAHVKRSLAKSRRLSESEREQVLERIITTSENSEKLTGCNFVIEAAPEDLALKQRILSNLEDYLSADAILATNTSALPIGKIAEAAQHPERIIGMHWFNPPELMPLVEIVKGEKTSQATIDATAALAVRLGKTPIIVNDVPGFLVNRMLSPYVGEALHMIQEGYRIEDIDRAAKEFGFLMGPVRLLDEIGLDTCEHVAGIMRAGYGDKMDSPPPYFEKMVSAGWLGKKSGEGFYIYKSKGEPKVNPRLRDFLDISRDVPGHERLGLIRERLVMSLVKEAIRCFDEGVAGPVGKEAAGQIDLGTVMGFGFPAFEGGAMSVAQKLKVGGVIQTLKMLEDRFGDRFTPLQSVLDRIGRSAEFY